MAASSAKPFSDPHFAHRCLKNRLHLQLSTIKSSHLSEAIAAGIGLKSHAALLQCHSQELAERLRVVDPRAVHERLLALGCEVNPDLTLPGDGVRYGRPNAPAEPLDAYRSMVRDLTAMRAANRVATPAVRALERDCMRTFATAFRLGGLESDAGLLIRDEAAADHAYCLPGWGRYALDPQGAFPRLDCATWFYERESVETDDGVEAVEMVSAIVSLPRIDSDMYPPQFNGGAYAAAAMGWSCQVVPQAWSWHEPDLRTPVIFKPKTPHEITVDRWRGSFRRWLFQSKARLLADDGQRSHALWGLCESPNLPLTTLSWLEFQEQFLNEVLGVAPRAMRLDHLAVRELFEKWEAQATSARAR